MNRKIPIILVLDTFVKHKIYLMLSYFLVLVQFTCLGLLGFYQNGVPTEWYFWLPEGLSILLVIWAGFALNMKNAHVIPNPRKEATLIKRGPYKLIRHPMYSALFLLTIPMTINYFNETRLVILIIFSVNMIYKMFYEEKLLKEKYIDYKNYMKSTFRLIPYIF